MVYAALKLILVVKTHGNGHPWHLGQSEGYLVYLLEGNCDDLHAVGEGLAHLLAVVRTDESVIDFSAYVGVDKLDRKSVV